jgi:hypothetical protein
VRRRPRGAGSPPLRRPSPTPRPNESQRGRNESKRVCRSIDWSKRVVDRFVDRCVGSSVPRRSRPRFQAMGRESRGALTSRF